MDRPTDHTLRAGRGRAVLQDVGLRVTPQRAAILELFDLAQSHWSAQNIFSTLEDAEPGLSLATVYNTLETFESVGLLRRFTTPDGQTLFDRNTAHHQHAVCTGCGCIQDLVMSQEALRGLLEETTERLEFEAFAANIWIRGVCAQCR